MPKQWQDDTFDDDEMYDDDLDYYEEEFGLDDEYTGFEKIPHRKQTDEETTTNKKRSSIKHQKRPDKE